MRWWWSYLLDACGLIPLLLFARKKRVAWVAAFCVMALWVVYAVDSRQWGFVPGALIYAGLHVRGWFAWRDKQEATA